MAARSVLLLAGFAFGRLLAPAGLPAEVFPLAIFLMRTLNMTLGTLRTLAVIRGRSASAWLLGFFESLAFVLSTVGVFEELVNPGRLLAFAGGYATGGYIGMVIESRLAPGHALLRIRSQERGAALAEVLRGEGYGATELEAAEQGNLSNLVLSYIPRRQVEAVRRLLQRVDPACRVSAENVLQLRGGWRV
jgi:uncharacterized protein YebE (UPF0316 family)